MFLCIVQYSYCGQWQYRVKNLYNLLSITDKLKHDTPNVHYPLREKIYHRKYRKRHDKARRKMLPNDTCQMIFKADTIHVLKYQFPARWNHSGGREEQILGNGIIMDYCTVPEWPECKNFVRQVMNSILDGEYKQLDYCESLHFDSTGDIRLTYFRAVRKDGCLYEIEKKHLIYGNYSLTLSIEESELYEVPDWEEIGGKTVPFFKKVKRSLLRESHRDRFH